MPFAAVERFVVDAFVAVLLDAEVFDAPVDAAELRVALDVDAFAAVEPGREPVALPAVTPADFARLVAVPAAARVPARAALGSLRGLATTSLKALPARNRGTCVLLIFTASPVRGLRPVRAARAAFSNVPNPVIATFPPLATSRMTTSTTASSASVAALRLPSRSSSARITSALFTSHPVVMRPGRWPGCVRPSQCPT